MDISEIRRRNLWSLAHPHGYSDQGVKLISDKSGKSEQRIRHLIAKDPDTKTAKNIGGNAAREFETTLGLENGWLDHPHPERWNLSDTPPQAQDTAKVVDISNFITIKQYSDVRGAMGKGAYLLDTEGEIVDWRVTTQWANNQLPANTGIENLRIITGLGDSMKGLYNSGDPLIIDTGIKSVDYDAVYFFRVGDEGYVKRLQKTPKGILVISQNSDYRDWTIEKDMDLEIFGRVLKVWEGKDL